jgi:toxin FitB
MFLVDANVLSEGMRPQPNRRVFEWLEDNEQEVVIDPVILGEIRMGILLLPVGRKRQSLERWFEVGVQKIVCLPWDAPIAIRWAELLAQLRLSGRSMPVTDSMIAATALTHDLTMVTRNVRDFKGAGLRVINPFDE